MVGFTVNVSRAKGGLGTILYKSNAVILYSLYSIHVIKDTGQIYFSPVQLEMFSSENVANPN